MKRLTNITTCMTTATAALMITAGIASAQTSMKAEVPFAFSVAGKVAEPGTYRVHMLNGNSRILSIYNTTTRHGYILVPQSMSDAPKKWADANTPTVAFDCSSGACAFSQAWFGEGVAYHFHGPKTRSGETMLTEIVMKPDRGN